MCYWLHIIHYSDTCDFFVWVWVNCKKKKCIKYDSRTASCSMKKKQQQQFAESTANTDPPVETSDLEAFKKICVDRVEKVMNRVKKKKHNPSAATLLPRQVFFSIISEEMQTASNPRRAEVFPYCTEIFQSLEGLGSNLEQKQITCVCKVGRKLCLCPTLGTMFCL